MSRKLHRLLAGSTVALTAASGLFLSPIAGADPGETRSPESNAENLAAEALPIVACDPAGPSGTDEAMARDLNARITGRMRGSLKAYEMSCARAVVRATYDRGLNNRAATIAVATIIVETTMRNYDGGHASSVGLFQQLDSWGPREERLNPKISAYKFFDTMERFYPKGSWNKEEIGKVCQRVQRSAFPERYQPEAADAQLIVDALGDPKGGGVNVPADRAVYEPSTASTEFFARGAKGELAHVWNTGGKWSAWEAHQSDYRLNGNPVSIYDAGARTTEVFARNSADQLAHTWHPPGQGWANWEVIDGGTKLKGEPVATYDAATKTVEVFARNTADQLVHAWHEPGKGWSKLEPINPDWRLASDPAPVYDPGTGSTEVFARGAQGELIHAWHPPGAGWSGFEVIGGGAITGAPFPVYEARTKTIEVFARNTADQLVHAWHPPGKGWSGLEVIGGGWQLASDPVAVYDPSTTTTEVFARGSQGELMHVWHGYGAGWSDWETLHSDWKFTGKPVAIYEANTRTVEVFGRGSQGELMHVWHTFGDGWSSWSRIGDWTIAE
ncbi:hypothetical protein [Crossiella sp. NPDC003009]